jgi:hypothetical protein
LSIEAVLVAIERLLEPDVDLDVDRGVGAT